MNIVIVESPAKAKTINKYRASDYTVLPSYGHMRDLPAKEGSVLPDANFAMEWEIDPKSLKHVKRMADAVKGADHLYLVQVPVNYRDTLFIVGVLTVVLASDWPRLLALTYPFLDRTSARWRLVAPQVRPHRMPGSWQGHDGLTASYDDRAVCRSERDS